ncbi:MAG: CoA transferase [Pseudorhodobacter sp.]|nr:CoA transferase [Frankiaceae bacterium]
MTGPLAGVRVLELAGIGPGPFATMLLADLGADVVRVGRVAPAGLRLGTGERADIVNRGKRSVAVDLKTPEGLAFVLDLVAASDVLVEGFRPGVAERLGLGPDACAARNPGLVYGRMTGWGQDGPLAQVAGHDIGYIALTGALWATGRVDERPTPALNLVGDYAGGSMFLVMGVLAALVERQRSGLGQVVDAAMVDGTSVLTTMFTALAGMGAWDLGSRGTNALDTGAPWYDVHTCSDGRWVAVGALEPQFYAELVARTDFRPDDPTRLVQPPRQQWDEHRTDWVALWATRTRDAWAELLGGTDACVQPVLTWAERAHHPHQAARGTFVEVDGVVQAAPAPRLSRTPGAVEGAPPLPGEHTLQVALDLGLAPEVVAALLASGALAQTA